jgi:hypothetical protein
MHPKDCPEWEYSKHPNSSPVLQKKIKAILIELRKGQIDSLNSVVDTRNIHQRLFHQLTPSEFPYYAGHYRGEDFRCLKYNQVVIPSDPRVGFPPNVVPGYMDEMSGFCCT